MERLRPDRDNGLLELDNTAPGTRHARHRPRSQEPPLRRIGSSRQGRRHRLNPDRKGQEQRRRSPRLARQQPRPYTGWLLATLMMRPRPTGRGATPGGP